MSECIETVHPLGFIGVEEDCRHCGGTGIATIHGNLLETVAGRREFDDAGFCSNCFGIGRVYWSVSGERCDDEVMSAMHAAGEEWLEPRVSAVRDRIAAGERHEIRRIG